MMPARFWQFYLGYILFSHGHKLKYFSNTITSIIFVIFFSILFIDYGKLNSIFISLILFSFLCSLKETSFFYKILISNSITVIGKYSYSLYLWHWPVIAFSYIFFGQTPLAIIVIVLLTALLSYFSYHVVETPLRYHNINFHKYSFIFLVWLFSFSFSYSLMHKYLPSMYVGEKKYSTRSTFTSLDGFKNCRFLKNNYTKLEYCERKSSNSNIKPTIYFTGDSISESLGILGYSLNSEFDVSINPKFYPGCLFPFAFHYTYEGFEKHHSKECENYNKLRINEIIKNGKKNDIVINANWYSFLLSYNPYDESRIASPIKMDKQLNEITYNESLKLYEKSLVDISNKLEKKGIKFIVLLPQLQLKEDLVNCRYQFFQIKKASPDCIIKKDSFLEFRKNLLSPFLNAKKFTNNLILWDPINIFCKDNLCGYFQNGHFNLYFDREHFSEYGAQLLYKNFLKNFSLHLPTRKSF